MQTVSNTAIPNNPKNITCCNYLGTKIISFKTMATVTFSQPSNVCKDQCGQIFSIQLTGNHLKVDSMYNFNTHNVPIHQVHGLSSKSQMHKTEVSYHFLQMSGALRRVPSPLHGTSQRMRSKYNPFISSSEISASTLASAETASKWPLLSFSPGKSWASWFVNMIFGLHMRLVWWIKRWHRCTSEP